MRFASIERDGKPLVVARIEDRLISLTDALPERPTDVSELLKIDGYLVKAAEAVSTSGSGVTLPNGSYSYRPVVPRPGKIVCLGLNYKDHAKELGKALPDFPIIFFRGATSLAAHKSALLVPKVSTQLDYEAELAAVIGERVRHATAEAALGAVLGVTCFNDGSIRDFQVKTPQITTGKNFDRTGGLGPEVVTLDELPQGPDELEIRCRLNGSTVQSSNTNQHVFKLPEAISILSSLMTLEPGDVIAMGTPGGVGFARTPPLWLKPGDVCEIEIEGVGCLQNSVTAEG
jgi:acylpyruvate hydrolase